MPREKDSPKFQCDGISFEFAILSLWARMCVYLSHILPNFASAERKRERTPKGICVSNTKAKFVYRNLHKIPSSSEQHHVVLDLREGVRWRNIVLDIRYFTTTKTNKLCICTSSAPITCTCVGAKPIRPKTRYAPATELYCSIYMCQHAIASGR